MCSVLGPMVQDIPEQDIVMGELELPPQMDPKPKMAAVCDTSPSLLRNPPPIPAETVRLSTADMAQLFAIIKGMNEKMEANMKEEMKNNTQAFINDMRTMRGETRQMGHGLQAGKMAPPCAATNELEGSAPAGEDRVSRETCRTRHEVTEEKKLHGVTETCTAGHQRYSVRCDIQYGG